MHTNGKEKQSISALMNAKQVQFKLSVTGHDWITFLSIHTMVIIMFAFTDCVSQQLVYTQFLSVSVYWQYLSSQCVSAALACGWYIPPEAPCRAVTGHHDCFYSLQEIWWKLLFAIKYRVFNVWLAALYNSTNINVRVGIIKKASIIFPAIIDVIQVRTFKQLRFEPFSVCFELYASNQ